MKLMPFHLARTHPPKSAPLRITPMIAITLPRRMSATPPREVGASANDRERLCRLRMVGVCSDGRGVHGAGTQRRDGGKCQWAKAPRLVICRLVGRLIAVRAFPGLDRRRHVLPLCRIRGGYATSSTQTAQVLASWHGSLR